jgi:hypothetical protein
MMAVHAQLTPFFHELGPSWQRVQVCTTRIDQSSKVQSLMCACHLLQTRAPVRVFLCSATPPTLNAQTSLGGEPSEKYRSLWKLVLSDLVFYAAFHHYVGHRELLSLEQAQRDLGCTS